MPLALPDVFAYLDYRAFLRDHYAAKKAEQRGYSFRVFSRRAGLRSPNYLKRVMDGERSLSAPMAARFAEACGLKGEGAAYFCDLVSFTQAKATDERNTAFARLSGFRRYRSAHKLELAQADYHATWYVPAVRELAMRKDFRADADWVAARLRPAISRAEAQRALDILFALGMLVRKRGGRAVQSEALVTTGAQTTSMHIANYHRTMMERAARAIDEIPAAERDVSSLTLAVSAGGLGRLKERIQRFRRELLELSALEEDPREVVQVNFQLFPLTQCERVAGAR